MADKVDGNRDEARIKTLQAAKRLFAQQGFYNTDRTEIRTTAHVGESTISTRFKDEELVAKEMILVEILERAWRRINRLIENLKETRDVRKRLKGVFSIILDTFEKDKELRIIFVAQSREVYKLGKRVMEGEVRKVIERLESIFVEGQSQGIFKKDLSPKSMQRACFGTIEEFLHSWVLNETIDYQTEVSREQLEKTIDSMVSGFSIKEEIPKSVDTREPVRLARQKVL